jgi:hypothetical protein
MSHIDTTVIRLLDGTRAYLHAVIDNFSRRILAICTPSSTTSLHGFWRGAWLTRSHLVTA